ncbi:MAG TPA: bifunctional folylpolyglutamate synthase/ dihydrofolate synthase [Candidatus Desulfovibrio intestinavium]|uniref:Dihydrofolate synthase/folylpolyglutamate synthase n=1 Tax=Candidatus Desulfovibrio intestinavium TaxID=2838534 RepID=A0A9D2HMI9_9BACT|nr:bifunctional folylpolyglutamate synthase/ dihydrofolate synthase [Candidatus Desulfovibrio intestinavium]
MRTPFSSFDQVIAHLDGRGFFHMELGLERMDQALARLLPGRPPFAVVQVLGTNGKGSTASFLDSLARAHGLRTGLYTSPHFVSPVERIRLNGRPLPAADWPAPAEEVYAACPELTYFEFLTVLALLLFARHGADLVILEAGLGGRNDATTACPADVLCYAPVALDHAAILGPTLNDIAVDKAAAIRSRAPVVSAPQYPVARAVIRAAADARSAPLVEVGPLPPGIPLGLAGAHQRVNAATALAAWRRIAPRCGLDAPAPDAPPTPAERRGLARAFIPGRLQSLPACAAHPALLLDGAHNPHGMQALTAHLRTFVRPPACAIFSCLGDKDWLPAARLLRRELGDAPIFVPQLHNERAAPAADIAAALNHGRAQAAARAVPDVAAALAAARECLPADASAGASPVPLSGSLYLLAEFFTLFPRHLAAPDVPAPTFPAPVAPAPEEPA